MQRDRSGMGPRALSYAEVKAWADLRRIALAPQELDTLILIDQAYMDVSAERQHGE